MRSESDAHAARPGSHPARTCRDIFKQYADGRGALGLNELADLFINVSRKITAFPATAQVAEQEGIYLAKKLNVLAKQHDAHIALDNGVYDDPDDMLFEPFNYKHSASHLSLAPSVTSLTC